MRIVGGIYRHRIINYPDDVEHIRPTKDRIREAIFSALGDLSNYKGLDLYSGSGAMGIEALSRGASLMTFVDMNKIAINVTKDNLKSLGINNAEVLFMKDVEAIDLFIKRKDKFDIVFLDPPYKLGQYEYIIKLLINNDLLSEHAVIVTECDKDVNIPTSLYNNKRDYKYGEIKVTIFRR